MEEKKQIIQISDDTVPAVKFWGTLSLAGVLLLVSVYFIISLAKEIPTPAIFTGRAAFLVMLLIAVTSAVLVFRRRQEMGLNLLFFGFHVLVVSVVSLFQGRTIPATFTILVIAFISIRWLLPRQAWRRYMLAPIIGVIVIWIMEWINPAWRVEVAAASVGPAAAIIFGTVLAVIMVTQAWKGNIRTKLITAFLVVTLTSLAIASFVNVRNTSAAITKNAQHNLTTAANELAASLDAFIEDNRDYIRTEAQNPDLVEYLSLPVSQRAGSPEEAKVTTLLQALGRRDPIYISSYALLDNGGVDLVDTYVPDIGINKLTRDYFQGPFTSGLPYVSPVEFSQTTGEAALYFGAPVRNAAKEIIGVLRVRYNAAVLQAYVSDAAGLAGDESHAILLNENYLRLADGLDPAQIYTSIVQLSPERIAELQAELHLPNLPPEQYIAAVPAFEAGLANLDTQPYFRAELHAGGGTLDETTAVQMATRPWLVVFFQPEDVFLAPVQAQTQAALVLSLIIAGVVIIAAYFVSQVFARPIVRLTNVATEISAGNLNSQAVVETTDEIGTLATAFNSMTSQLREFIGTLEQRVDDRTKAIATSSAVSRRLSTILDRRGLFIEVVEQVKNAFEYYHAHIYTLDPETGDLIMAGGTGDAGAAMLASEHKVPKGRGLVGRAAETNEPVLVPDTTHDPGWLPNPLLPDTKSEVAIPISVGDEVLGVLDVQHDVTNGLGQEDVDALSSIANQVAIAMQNIESAETVAKRAKELETVASISTATATIQDTFEMLSTMVHLTQRGFGLYHAHVFTYQEEGDELQIVACGYREGDEHEGTHGTSVIPMAQEVSLVARAARTRQPVIVNDVRSDPGWLPNPLLPETRAELAVPMIVGDQLLGVLDVQSERLNAFTQEDANIQMTLASQVATALQNAQSYNKAQKQAAYETTLNLIAQKIQAASTIEEAMQVAARELGHALGKRQTLVALDPTALAGGSRDN